MADFNKVELPENVKLAGKVLDSKSRLEEQRLAMGWFGRAFGNAGEKPGNVAGAAIIFSFLMLLVVMFTESALPGLPRAQLYTLFGGIITLALGFVFGRSGN